MPNVTTRAPASSRVSVTKPGTRRVCSAPTSLSASQTASGDASMIISWRMDAMSPSRCADRSGRHIQTKAQSGTRKAPPSRNHIDPERPSYLAVCADKRSQRAADERRHRRWLRRISTSNPYAACEQHSRRACPTIVIIASRLWTSRAPPAWCAALRDLRKSARAPILRHNRCNNNPHPGPHGKCGCRSADHEDH